jgi:cell division protein FtsZ
MANQKKNTKKIVKKLKPARNGKILSTKIKIQKNKKVVKKITKKNVAKKSVKKAVIKKPAKKVIKKITKKLIKKVAGKKVEKTKLKQIPNNKLEKKHIVSIKSKDIGGKATVIKHSKNKSEGVFAAESLFKAKIKVIGVGGGGGSIVSEIGRSLEKATFVIADTDIRALKKRTGMKYLWFGEDLTHGLGTGVNVDLAKQAAEGAKEKMCGYFKDQDIIIFIASLGGGLGSGATQVFAEAAKEFGGITFGIFTMPFKFEGKNKQRIAQNALKSLRKSLNVSLVIPNEKIFKIIDESTPIINAFSTVNKSLIESLESLIDLIYSPGVINIDFADLRTILRGRGNSAFLNTIEESGKNAVENICENIFKNPLLQTGSFKTEKILFNVAGGDSLSMFQVEKISSHISDLNPKAKIIFGISKNAKLKNKIKTTILMTGASAESSQEEELVVPMLPKNVDVKVIEVKKNPAKKVGEMGVGAVILQEKLEKNQVIAKKEEKQLSVAIVKKPAVSKTTVKKEEKVKKPVVLAKKVFEKVVSNIDKKVVASKPVLNAIEVVKKPATNPSTLKLNKPEVIVLAADNQPKRSLRRSGIEIKEAEYLQEEKRIAQEKEWEIPAFLRKVKFKG